MKRNTKAGIALAVLSFLHNKKAMIIIGAILIGIGAAGAIFIGPMLIQDYVTDNIDATTDRPYPIFGIVSPVYTQITFIGIAIVGLALLVWYAAGTRRAKPSLPTINCGFIALKSDEGGSQDYEDNQCLLRKIPEVIMRGIRSGLDKVYLVAPNEEIAKSVSGKIE
jgi:hypothetical protein